eukprot:EG_transcript_4551
MTSTCEFPQSLHGVFACSPSKTVRQQLQALLASREVQQIRKVTDADLKVLQQEVLPHIEKRPAPVFAQSVLGSATQADALLRSYLACLDRNHIVNPGRTEDMVAGNSVKVAQRDVYRCMNYLQAGIRLSRQPNCPTQIKSLLVVLSTTNSSNPTVDLTPQTVELNTNSVPDNLSADQCRNASPEFMQQAYDCMLQKLVRSGKFTLSEFPQHPIDRGMALAGTQDVEHLPLPMVRAELPNLWIQTDFQRQVLSILTFYKIWQVHAHVLRDMEEWGWPRDLNARGFTIFYPQSRGTELLFKECGVRVHSSDREYSQQQLRTMTAKEVADLFGEPEKRGVALQTSLSEREKRQVMEILNFPFTLVAAFLRACKRNTPTGRITAPPSEKPKFRSGRIGSPLPGKTSNATIRGARTVSQRTVKETESEDKKDSKISRLKQLIKSIATLPTEKPSNPNPGTGSVPTTSPNNPLAGTVLGALYNAMCSESCVNLRFFALMEEVRSIMDIKSVGQTIGQACEELVKRDPALDRISLDEMVNVTANYLQRSRLTAGWDEKEALVRTIDDTDVRVHLRHLGYE